MTRKFCDCCRAEFKDLEQHAVIQMTQELYTGITKGAIQIFHKETKDDEELHPFVRMMRNPVEIMQLEVCIECMRSFVALREQMIVLQKQSHLKF